MIENGVRTPSHKLLSRIAGELGVPVAALLDDAPPAKATAPHTASADVVRALMGYGLSRMPAVEPAELRDKRSEFPEAPIAVDPL